MQTVTQDHPLAGRLISGLAVAFLIFDSIGKLLRVAPVIDGTRQLGYPPDIVFSLGVTLLSCVLVYLVPRTSVLGAVLLTGYLGGAVVTHLLAKEPIVFPILFGMVIWLGIFLREPRLRSILFWRCGT